MDIPITIRTKPSREWCATFGEFRWYVRVGYIENGRIADALFSGKTPQESDDKATDFEAQYNRED